MTSPPLLTLRAIAHQLDVPESTVRYYRDVFEPFLPAHGRGRRRRYPTEALPLFQLIAEGYARNRSRQDIEDALLATGDGNGGNGSPAPQPAPAPLVHQALTPWQAPGTADHLLATVLDGERERREVMWQMAREIVRLGEAIERQQVLLNEIARRVDGTGHRTLPPPAHPEAPVAKAESPPVPDTSRLDDELETLRQELEHERELVDRLRRSKLAIERRAAAAESALRQGPAEQTEGPSRRGVLRRVLGREEHGPADG